MPVLIAGPFSLTSPTVTPLGAPNWVEMQAGTSTTPAVAGTGIQTGPSGAFGHNATRSFTCWNPAVNTFPADQWVSATVVNPPTVAGPQIGVGLRGTGSGTAVMWYSINLTSTGAGIGIALNSTSSASIFSTPYTPHADTHLAMDIVGSTLRLWIDGQLVYNHVPDTNATTGATLAIIPSGQPGVTGYNLGNPPNITNWQAGSGAYDAPEPPEAIVTGKGRGFWSVRTG